MQGFYAPPSTQCGAASVLGLVLRGVDAMLHKYARSILDRLAADTVPDLERFVQQWCLPPAVT